MVIQYDRAPSGTAPRRVDGLRAKSFVVSDQISRQCRRRRISRVRPGDQELGFLHLCLLEFSSDEAQGSKRCGAVVTLSSRRFLHPLAAMVEIAILAQISP